MDATPPPQHNLAPPATDMGRSDSRYTLSAPVDHQSVNPTTQQPWTVAAGLNSPLQPRFKDLHLSQIHLHTQHPQQDEEREKENENESEHEHEKKQKRRSGDMTIGSVFSQMGVAPLYVYECDQGGRVKGERLPMTEDLTKYERVLVVGQHAEHLFHLVK